MIKVYEIKKDKLQAVKNVLEAKEKPDKSLGVDVEVEAGKGKKEEAMEWKINEFSRTGYILREGKALGYEIEESYLYIKASEDFFERNEKLLIDAGAELLEDKKAEDIIKKIEEKESEASSGIGFVFK